MCIWKVKPQDRLCRFCCYAGPCEKIPATEEQNGRFRHYLSAINTLTGRNVLLSGQESQAVWGRHILAFQLKTEGMRPEDIGRLLGKSRVTVIHSVNMVRAMLQNKQSYSREHELWEKFQSLVNGSKD
jgi:hypothetical protein